MSKENYSSHQESKTQTQLGSSTESKVILETTRTTSATMRMEHKPNFPDLPITFSQRTQTPTIPLISEGTMMDSLKRETKKSQTEATQTQSSASIFEPAPVLKPQEPIFKPQEATAPASQSIPFPFSDKSDDIPVSQPPEPLKKSALDFFENNLKNLPPLQDDKYTRFEDTLKGSKTYVHKQNEVKEQFRSKLTEDLSYLNLVPEPPPEMGFMPKVQKGQPERLVEKVKKLEESHQSSETPLSGGVFPQSFKKEEKYEKKEFLSTSTVSTSPFLQQNKPASPFLQQKPASPFVHKPVSPLPTYTPQANRDQLFTADPKLTRSPSPKPSTEAVNMEKLWALKVKSPEPFTVQQQQQQSFSHEHKSSFVAYSSQQTHMQQSQHEKTLPSTEHFVPIQTYPVEPPQQQQQEELPKMSIKDTKSYFEQRIKQEEVKTLPTDLKAPGLVRQFAKPMVPLIPLDLEPGSPPEICYAPKPVLERKQSYVEKIEKTLEQNLEKEPERVPRGGVRIIPTRQTPQRSVVSPPPQQFPVAAPLPVIEHVIKPEPLIMQPPAKIIAEPFVPQLPQQFEQFQTKEIRSENFEMKNEFSSVGYRHVEPPKFGQIAKVPEVTPVPVPVFEAPKPQQPIFKKPEPLVQPPREVPIAIQKPEPVKPILQQHKPVSMPRPFVQAKPKFSNEFTSETHETHSLYKNFVKSEESTHSSESYFQKIDPSKMVQSPPQQQQFVPPPQQVRKKHLPDVML